MTDCRFILDNLNDYASQIGPLVTGSDVVDISGAQMTPGADGWQVVVKTVSPAQQNPRLAVSAAVFIDVDGRTANNVADGPAAGADTVYSVTYGAGHWAVAREVMSADGSGLQAFPTKTTYTVTGAGYTLDIPYSEVAKTAPAYWRVGVIEKDAARTTVDYAPDGGYSCTPSIAPANAWVKFAGRVKTLMNSNAGDGLIAGAVVLAALVVLFWRWTKRRKNKNA